MSRAVDLPWTLTPPQAEVFRATERFLVLVAGRRFGKTVLAVVWLLVQVMRRPPGALGYYVAPYRVMAKAIAWDILLMATKGLRSGPPNASELTVPLIGGRKIALKGADDPETLEGVGLDAAVLDEFGRMKLAAWQSSLRPALSDKSGRALFCGKPRGHNHLKDFYERGQGPTRSADWRSWLHTTADGGHVPAEDMAEAKRTLPSRVFRQEYEASFETLAGRVYEDFLRRTHVIRASEMPSHFRGGVVGVDWGFTSAGVMLPIMRTGTGRRIITAQQVHIGKLVDAGGWLAVAKAIRSDSRLQPLDCFAADPSESGHIAALRNALDGRPVVRAADNRWHEGHRRVSIALQPMADGRPGLLVTDDCFDVIREFEGYVFQERDGRTTEEPVDVDDHCMDAIRYGEMAHPPMSAAA